MNINPAPLKPRDVIVALALAEWPEEAYAPLGARLAMSPSVVHAAVARLQGAGLLMPGTRTARLGPLRQFLVRGVPHAFPGALGPVVRGVSTSHAGPDLVGMIAGEPVVWPHAEGEADGASVAPLDRSAVHLPARAPGVYANLALVDALRVGRVRERRLAAEILATRLGHQA